MPVIQVRALEIVVRYLPRISADLKRIADALEACNPKTLPSKIYIDGKLWNVAYKKPLTKGENSNG